MLTISGERKNEREQKEGESFRSERYFGKFQRSVTLPTAVDSKNVKATYKEGVLTIHLPKAEEAKPKQIANQRLLKFNNPSRGRKRPRTLQTQRTKKS